AAQPLLSPGVFGHARAAASLGRLFVHDAATDRIQELDPVTGAVLRSFPSPVPAASGTQLGLATTAATLLLAGPPGSPIFELDPDTGATLRTVPNPNVTVSGLAFLNGELYLLTNAGSGRLTVLDYDTGAVARAFTLPFGLFDAVASAGTDLLGLNG